MLAIATTHMNWMDGGSQKYTLALFPRLAQSMRLPLLEKRLRTPLVTAFHVTCVVCKSRSSGNPKGY